MQPYDQSLTAALVEYARNHASFTAEQAWAHVEQARNWQVAPQKKGQLFRLALIAPGHVVKAGTQRAKNPQAKGRQLTVWKSVLCASPEELVSLSQQLSAILGDINQHRITVMEGLKKAYEIGATG